MSALLRVRERRALADKSAGSLPPSMRMRQSLAQFEEAFREEAAESIVRRERLRKESAQRSRVRRVERTRKLAAGWMRNKVVRKINVRLLAEGKIGR